MYKNMLPVGSVVLLKEGDKKVMICGRVQTRSGDEVIYDYSACYYPEGIMDPRKMTFFNRDDIERVYFIGFQDPEEIAFRTNILDNLKELEVRDGKIVAKEE
ncbi:MAG: DUF4176 domain-containing protein [Clostridia bacterium]|nr:DUF4176 domain-containing protein [Clostridia bacterium]